jgi:hypothetical protein
MINLSLQCDNRRLFSRKVPRYREIEFVLRGTQASRRGDILEGVDSADCSHLLFRLHFANEIRRRLARERVPYIGHSSW